MPSLFGLGVACRLTAPTLPSLAVPACFLCSDQRLLAKVRRCGGGSEMSDGHSIGDHWRCGTDVARHWTRMRRQG